MLKPDLPPVPEEMCGLPIDPVRLIPVPWFVPWEGGRPEFRVAGMEKFVEAVRGQRCWVCGNPLKERCVFVLGPMCCVNRVSAEPPSHLPCAVFSVRACPFLSKPRMERRDVGDIPDAASAGIMIERNPGVIALWETKSYRLRRDGGGWLFTVGDPLSVSVWACGRTATAEEIAASFDSGLPALEELARRDGPGALEELARRAAEARKLLGI